SPAAAATAASAGWFPAPAGRRATATRRSGDRFGTPSLQDALKIPFVPVNAPFLSGGAGPDGGSGGAVAVEHGGEAEGVAAAVGAHCHDESGAVPAGGAGPDGGDALG